jgi:uncharacterized secreted repeat protein (TIGR03808 family)
MNIARRSLLSAVAFLTGTEPLFSAVKTNKVNNLQSEIDKAIQGGGVVKLPGGTFSTGGLKITGSVRLEGVMGQTKLISLSGGPVLEIIGAADVSLNGITFVGRDVLSTDELSSSAIVMAQHAKNLRIEECSFTGTPFSGLKLENCSGRITGNHFLKLGESGLFAIDSEGLEISGNDVEEIGNNGIQVWRNEIGVDGTQIVGNRISNIKANAGGDGQNGNAIGVFRSGNVMAVNNRISGTAFSAIRFNSASNCQIIGNSISQAGETAIYVEFAFQGAVVSNNVLEDVAFGISITNYNDGGRLALCTGNVVRNAKRGKTVNADVGHGIHAEADTLVSNNVVEDIESFGVNLGWGKYSRNLTAQGNIVRNCGRGITFSMSEGAGQTLISGNMIDGARIAAIQGMDHENPQTGDLGAIGAKIPSNVTLSNNTVTS